MRLARIAALPRNAPEPRRSEPRSSRRARPAGRSRPHSHALTRPLGRRLAKRAMDIALVSISLPLTLPLVLACALAVKLENRRAPAFFRQQRTGKHGKRFTMIKLRTMVPEAEAMRPYLSRLNERGGPAFKIVDDPRVTPVGRVLRKLCLDELPQLLNVLRGEMSLVGPRPTSWSVQKYEEWQKARLLVTPGMTGLWQLLNTSTGAFGDFDDWVKLDLAYIERATIWLDVKLILGTVWTLVARPPRQRVLRLFDAEQFVASS